MLQLHLNFLDLPTPESRLWDQLDDQHKKLAVETLARLLTKASITDPIQEQNHE
jgi:hypothetical protein